MSDLSSMRNIGKEMEKKLKAVDIHTAQELIDIGSKEAFVRLKARDPKMCLVHLYALEGAVSDMEYNHLAGRRVVKWFEKINLFEKILFHSKHFDDHAIIITTAGSRINIMYIS